MRDLKKCIEHMTDEEFEAHMDRVKNSKGFIASLTAEQLEALLSMDEPDGILCGDPNDTSWMDEDEEEEDPNYYKCGCEKPPHTEISPASGQT